MKLSGKKLENWTTVVRSYGGKVWKGLTTHKFVIKYGAELECWYEFIKHFR